MQTEGSATVYLGLGSNLGDRESNLARARDMLTQRVKLDEASRIYQTMPVGDTEQPMFLNQVCRVHTILTPDNLLVLAKGIERRLGRAGRSGQPRPIDIDILFYDSLIYDSEALTIPHPRAHQRAFVLVPLYELAAEMAHPKLNITIRELRNNVSDDGVALWEGEPVR